MVKAAPLNESVYRATSEVRKYSNHLQKTGTRYLQFMLGGFDRLTIKYVERV